MILIHNHIDIYQQLKNEKDRKRKLTFGDINMQFYNDLNRWCGEQKYSLNTYGDIVKNVKVFYKAAGDEGIKTQALSDKFTTVSAETDSIYLTVDELKMLADLDINEKLILEHYNLVILNVSGNVERAITSLTDCRDRFIIGSFTAMRFSDYAFLKGLKSTDKYVQRISEKTGTKTVIPMHPFIKDILIRRKESLPPAVSNQKMNKQLKVLGKMAKLNDKIEVTINKVSGKERKTLHKWELLTTHTARRSGCTNMFLAGIDVVIIMSFSGHRTTKSFLKYIKATQQQVAEKLIDHPFFK